MPCSSARDGNLPACADGRHPASVLAHDDSMNITGEAGRGLLGSASPIRPQVRVRHASTQDVLAERHYREQETDPSFSGNIGILVEVARNVIDAANNHTAEDAARKFTGRVRAWPGSRSRILPHVR